MKLDRNTNLDRKGKYALIKLRTPNAILRTPNAIEGPDRKFLPETKFAIVQQEAIDFGETPETEFFVIRLKDKYAYEALRAYALAATIDDPDYALDVMELAAKAHTHPSKRRPD